MKKYKQIIRLSVILICAFSYSAHAEMNSTEVNHRSYQVPLNTSLVIDLEHGVGQITKGNPSIADILLFPPSKILLRGKNLGVTNSVILNKKNQPVMVLDIEVTHNLTSLKSKLYEILPDEKIFVRSAQKNIILSGQISALDKMQAAVDLAESYLGASSSKQLQGGGKHQATSASKGDNKEEKSKGDVPHIINLMSVGGVQQVMLEVKIAEMSRTISKGMSVKFNAVGTSGDVRFGTLSNGGALGPLDGLLASAPHTIDAASIFVSVISGGTLVNVSLQAAEEQKLAKILAEPNLTTISGQEATFVSGGEFPIPVPQSLGGGAGNTITVVFKEYGIKVRFLPVVLDSGRINLNMNVSVSELSDDVTLDIAGGGDTSFAIPSLTKREASSSIEVGDGQTMSIAGLINDTVKEQVSKFPVLGDIPYLGVLFRDIAFLKNQTELMIFVTPHLVKPITTDKIALPTDSFIEPDDIDFYLLGKIEGRETATDDFNNEGGLEGNFGHQLDSGDGQ